MQVSLRYSAFSCRFYPTKARVVQLNLDLPAQGFIISGSTLPHSMLAVLFKILTLQSIPYYLMRLDVSHLSCMFKYTLPLGAIQD